MNIEIQQLFNDNGTVEELQLDEELQAHLLQHPDEKHNVSFAELIEVHQNKPLYYLNAAGHRAPIYMVGPTTADRFLFVPIEPTGTQEVWRPVTAFTANTIYVNRYKQDINDEYPK